MQRRQRLFAVLLVVALALGSGGWVFNPSQKPGRGITWTRYQTEKQQTREEAVARQNYCPTGGCVIRLDDLQLSPQKAAPGSTLTLTTTYTIITPENVDIPITISRELFVAGKSLGRVTAMNANNKNGTYIQTLDFTLPKDAVPGRYTLVTRISTGFGQDEKRLEFPVN